MDIEEFKKLVKKYEPQHTGFIVSAAIGERYYKNGSDILFAEKKEDKEGNTLRNADNRIPRNYHALLVNQKVSYAFKTPPVFDVGNAQVNMKIVEILGDEYIKNCMELCVNAANTSIGWIHYWKNELGEFEWAIVDSKEIIPIWDKSLKRKLLGVMRTYEEIDEENGESYVIYEYWTESECQAYRRKASFTVDEGLWQYEMFSDPDTNELAASYYHAHGEVPFIPFFNNNILESDLSNVKKLIDVYDKVYSGFINDLDDVQELILVLSGYGGTELNGFLQDLKKYKVINLDDDENAGVSTLNIEIPVEARKVILDITRKAIFEQGQGFDPQPENFGNQSGEALKFMYSLLEMKVGFMETEFRPGFAKLIRAICRHYNLPCKVIKQSWTRNGIKNDTEQAQICKDSVGIVSQKTILSKHPLVENVEEELKQLEKEEKKVMEKENIYKEAFESEEQVKDNANKETE